MNPLLTNNGQLGFHAIGRDPHDCTIDELKVGGFIPHSSTTAIRRMCMQCMGNSSATVSECSSTICALWPWRMGTRPDAWKGLSAGPNSSVTGKVRESYSPDSMISERSADDEG
ncbi:hypothetical protein N9100_00930 [Gammaproteobacteria bacterium]|nr:hypothetical protein [Gammaproteobacteria bacterium]